jgi:hypothetical protein
VVKRRRLDAGLPSTATLTPLRAPSAGLTLLPARSWSSLANCQTDRGEQRYLRDKADEELPDELLTTVPWRATLTGGLRKPARTPGVDAGCGLTRFLVHTGAPDTHEEDYGMARRNPPRKVSFR